MRTILADHPLIAHKLTTLRDERTDSPTFRRLVEEFPRSPLQAEARRLAGGPGAI